MPTEIDYLKLLRRVDALEMRVSDLEATEILVLEEEMGATMLTTLKDAEKNKEAIRKQSKPVNNVVDIRRDKEDE